MEYIMTPEPIPLEVLIKCRDLLNEQVSHYKGNWGECAQMVGALSFHIRQATRDINIPIEHQPAEVTNSD